jgi:hypothetical protein
MDRLGSSLEGGRRWMKCLPLTFKLTVETTRHLMATSMLSVGVSYLAKTIVGCKLSLFANMPLIPKTKATYIIVNEDRW